jgi:nicotinic acid mononucleotide adenylyltransferase
LALVATVVVTRPGYELFTEHVTDAVRARIVDLRGAVNEQDVCAAEMSGEPRIYFTDVVNLDIASRHIRRAVCAAGADEKLEEIIQVPQPVAEYIKKYGLYREAHETERNDAGRERTHD